MIDSFKLASDDSSEICKVILVDIAERGPTHHVTLMKLISSASRSILDLFYDDIMDKPICGPTVEEVYKTNPQALKSFVLKSVKDASFKVTDACVTGFFKHCRESGSAVRELFEAGESDALFRVMTRLMGTAAGARDLTWFLNCWIDPIIKVFCDISNCIIEFR